MPKVVLQGYIIVPEKDLALIINELENHRLLTWQEEGCLVFNVEQSPNNLCRFNVYEEFTDQAAFEFHQQRVKASLWGKLSQNAKRYYQITNENN
ncbi:putative quinol monooxygenase [Vibrio algivorus]|uniref:Antibiotic biosynthesis monooxygenase n=1 Tax=Vibrio algivorus TaxID=1667024 RepID=A0A557PFF9_9VIBR|nr:antibiotic biosynthesis monooxygenase [Vibrio algivorus]TVO39392.1 antibiotic biosynthesis monooxygenase [Vibrio algivorus]GLT14471.1 antibiotic biosynthesis monooxygenase [Vibrio algivorus]